MALQDIKKIDLKEWDLFRFINWELVYYVYKDKETDELRYTGYTVETRYTFSTDVLTPFQFEIIGTVDGWIDPEFADLAKRYWEKAGITFLDS